ncbi:hypothetical protein AGMMS49992_31920 [Clostridia bacterium]|nr:hypothetical protein AGMMS49992_31920 [Clostridia bacterium]
MSKEAEMKDLKCPICGRTEGQTRKGYNRSGTQRCYCKHCNKKYTNNPKDKAYSQEKREEAMKLYLSGTSGRKVGNILGMIKANAVRWLKKSDSDKG